mmetsp:Transcript_136985/g.324520  ORF Transcript_136985/g.324520 Transcript_136985/m.324520 type:complete len:206 (-) Transcript_136985:328-945(-)
MVQRGVQIVALQKVLQALLLLHRGVPLRARVQRLVKAPAWHVAPQPQGVAFDQEQVLRELLHFLPIRLHREVTFAWPCSRPLVAVGHEDGGGAGNEHQLPLPLRQNKGSALRAAPASHAPGASAHHPPRVAMSHRGCQHKDAIRHGAVRRYTVHRRLKFFGTVVIGSVVDLRASEVVIPHVPVKTRLLLLDAHDGSPPPVQLAEF